MVDLRFIGYGDRLLKDTNDLEPVIEDLRNRDGQLSQSFRDWLADMLSGEDSELALVVKRKSAGKPVDRDKLLSIATDYNSFRSRGISKSKSREFTAEIYDCSVEYIKRVCSFLDKGEPNEQG